MMFSQESCKARIWSFLVTGMTLRISLPIKFQTCSFIQGPVIGMAMEWWICPAAPTMRQFDALWGLEHWPIETRMDDFWHQISFVQNQEGYLTIFSQNCPHSHFHRGWSDCQHLGSQWPPHLTEAIRFLLTMHRRSGIFSPAVLHTLTLPSQHARLNLDTSEKSKQDQLYGTVQLRVLIHHPRRQFSKLISVYVQQHGCRLPDRGAFSGQFIWKLNVQGV